MSQSFQGDSRVVGARGRTHGASGVAEAWHRLAAALQDAAGRDPQIREAVRTLASWLHDLAGEAGSRDGVDRAPIELPLIAARSRLKAEACRWVLRRRAHQREDQAPEDALRAADLDLINRAREHRACWLWMLQSPAEAPDEIFEQLALVYEALAGATELCDGVAGRSNLSDERISEVYHLLAEAQSALWAGMQVAGAQRDQDQIDAFVWLRERTREERVYIERHMRREDPADPAAAPDLLHRITRAREAMDDLDALEPQTESAGVR